MIDESMYLIPKIMVEDEIEHHGRVHRHPAPADPPEAVPGPAPADVHGVHARGVAADAGARGIGALVLGFGGPEEVAKKNEIYREAFANRKPEDQVGFRPTEHLAALCPAIVLDDGDEARTHRHPRSALLHGVDWLLVQRRRRSPTRRQVGRRRRSPSRQTSGDTIIRTTLGVRGDRASTSPTPTLAMLNPNHAYGTVDGRIGYVGRLVDAGADEILFLCQMGTVPQGAQLETIRNIGEHVIPYFKDAR